MRILIITDSFPFPPKNGKDLPIANIFQRISEKQNVKVDILVLCNNEKEEQLTHKKTHLQNVVANVFTLKVKVRGLFQRRLWVYKRYIFNPGRVNSFAENKNYDWAWVSPYPCYGFVDFCRKHKIALFSRVAIGLNDDLAYAYKNKVSKLIKQKSFSFKVLALSLQSLLIKKEEQIVFKNVNLVHVQTKKEKERLLKVLGGDMNNEKKVIAEPNGIKEELLTCNYEGIDSNNILCMTQLGKGRREETKWFFANAWPLIKKECPGLKLLVVGSRPTKHLSFIEDDPNINLLGYVDDLKRLYNSVSISVVPTFHSSGLINRILDSLTAGVPTVSTPQAVGTFLDMEIGEHILTGENPEAFALAVINLHKSALQKRRLSENGRRYANGFNTWRDTADDIFKKLL